MRFLRPDPFEQYFLQHRSDLEVAEVEFIPTEAQWQSLLEALERAEASQEGPPPAKQDVHPPLAPWLRILWNRFLEK
jgi:hypothetical protein